MLGATTILAMDFNFGAKGILSDTETKHQPLRICTLMFFSIRSNPDARSSKNSLRSMKYPNLSTTLSVLTALLSRSPSLLQYISDADFKTKIEKAADAASFKWRALEYASKFTGRSRSGGEEEVA